MGLTLYTFPASLWAGVPRLFVHQNDIPNVKFVTVDLSKAENFAPDYLKVQPNHTVPALTIEENGSTRNLDDTTSVIDYLNQLVGNKYSIPEKDSEISEFLKYMHGEADVGNPLFFTSGSQDELDSKKDLIVGFLNGRIAGWERYLKEAPEHADLYNENIKSTKELLAPYLGDKEATTKMFALNKQLWEAGVKFLDHTESVLTSNGGDFLFGKESVADFHMVPYLFRDLLVRKPEQVFANHPNLEAYYKRAQARPSFAQTFQ
jgi:glutathione S-transferase